MFRFSIFLSLKKYSLKNILENKIDPFYVLCHLFSPVSVPDIYAFIFFTIFIYRDQKQRILHFLYSLNLKMSIELTRNPKAIFMALPLKSWRFFEITFLLRIQPHQFFLYGSNHVHVFIYIDSFLLD